MRIEDLTQDPKNANRGTEAGRRALEASLKKLKYGRSILIDKHGAIIAGNKTARAAQALGAETVRVITTDGKELIAVQREDLDLETDPEARRLAYADNLVGQLDFMLDTDQVLADLADGLDLADFAEALALEGETPKKKRDPDAGLSKESLKCAEAWPVEPGQVWQVGPHTIYIGDNLDAPPIESLHSRKADLIFTDPPYNVGEQNEGGKRDFRKACRDLADAEWDRGFDPRDVAHLLTDSAGANASAYICTSHWLFGDWVELGQKYFDRVAFVAWCKPNPMPCLHKRLFTSGTELIAFWGRGKYTFNFPEAGHALDHWEILRENSPWHPTQKPLEIPSRAIAYSSKPGDLVFDPFGGSGSTLIAAEKLGRHCYLIERDPEYAARILERCTEEGLSPDLLMTKAGA